MIKTYRGLLEDGEENKIRLSTKKGKIGYKIRKFQIIGNTPGTAEVEAVIKIFKVPQASITSQIDFSDGNLLAAAEHREFAAAEDFSSPQVIIFEQEIFNQDIFITYKAAAGSMAMNYYLELETMPLSDNAAAVSTLRDIRLNPQVGA